MREMQGDTENAAGQLVVVVVAQVDELRESPGCTVAAEEVRQKREGVKRLADTQEAN